MQMFSSAAPGIARNSYNITGQNSQSLRYVILRQVAVTDRKLPCCRVIYSPESLSCPYLVLVIVKDECSEIGNKRAIQMAKNSIVILLKTGNFAL